jgi:hypothetical protein
MENASEEQLIIPTEPVKKKRWSELKGSEDFNSNPTLDET